MSENYAENENDVDYSIYIYHRKGSTKSRSDGEVDYEIVEEGNDSIHRGAVDSASDRLPTPIHASATSGDSTADKVVASISALKLCDDRSDNAQPYEGKRYRDRSRRRSKGRRFVITVTVIIMSFLLVILVADLLSNGYISGKIAGVFTGKGEDKTYYAVELASFVDMDSARVMSGQVRASGAGGYVINDELYRVIADVYPTKKDALSVSTKLNLDGYVTSVYEITVSEVNYQLFPTSTRNITRKVMDYAEDIYSAFYRLGLEIDGGKIDYASAGREVTSVINRTKNLLTDYESNCDNQVDDDCVVMVRSQLGAIIGAMENIANENNGLKDMVSDIRYVNTMILNTHRALTRSLSGMTV